MSVQKGKQVAGAAGVTSPGDINCWEGSQRRLPEEVTCNGKGNIQSARMVHIGRL